MDVRLWVATQRVLMADFGSSRSRQQHGIHEIAAGLCRNGIIDLDEREGADQRVEGETTLRMMAQQFRNERLRIAVALNDADDE
jgi:hypothetical protein